MCKNYFDSLLEKIFEKKWKEATMVEREAQIPLSC